MRPILLLALLLPACATPVRTVPAETMVPDEGLALPVRYTSGYFMVRARIDGLGPYWLLLDTGTDRLVVDAEIAGRHEASVRDTDMQVRSATGTAAPMRSLLRIRSLQLGGAEFKDLDAGVLDLSRLSESLDVPVQGLLGCSVFAHCLLTLDYPARQVRLDRGRLGPVDHREILELGGDTPWVQARLAGHPVRLLLDSGFGREVAIPPYLKGIPLTGPPRRFGEVITVAGPHPQYLARIDGDLELGRYRIRHPLATLSPGSPKIGARALRRFVVTLDMAGRRVRMTRARRRI